MNDTVVETIEVAEKSVNPNIVKGRMPVAVVAQVRFGNDKDEPTKALASLYGTTVGKIDDIKKGRNFAYVDSSFKPTEQQKTDGIAWLQRHPKFNEGVVDAIITELETTPEATPEEALAFESARVAARGQSPVTKEGEMADAGGGNRRQAKAKKTKKAKATAEAVADPESYDSTAEELLA